MKQKQHIIRWLFSVVLLVSIVLRLFHEYEHIEEQRAEKICFHKQANKKELTHQHKNLEQCLVCSFAFGSAIDIDVISSSLKAFFYTLSNDVIAPESIPFFSGSQNLLRGPPVCIIK